MCSLKDNVTALHDAGITLRLGTACSGTDVVVTVMTLLSDAACFKVRHVFSCDADADVRTFIRTCHTPQYVFADIRDMGRAVIFDELSQNNVETPEAARQSCKH